MGVWSFTPKEIEKYVNKGDRLDVKKLGRMKMFVPIIIIRPSLQLFYQSTIIKR